MQVGWRAVYEGCENSTYPGLDTLLLSTQMEICTLHLSPLPLAPKSLTLCPCHQFAPLYPLLFGPWEPQFAQSPLSLRIPKGWNVFIITLPVVSVYLLPQVTQQIIISWNNKR